MINKNIKKILTQEKIKNLNLKTSLRPTDLSPETYYKITEFFEKKIKSSIFIDINYMLYLFKTII